MLPDLQPTATGSNAIPENSDVHLPVSNDSQQPISFEETSELDIDESRSPQHGAQGSGR